MKKQKVYFYPSASRGGYTNPYSINYKSVLSKKYNVLDAENKPVIALSLSFMINAFRADIYIINWLESICFMRLSLVQYLLARIGLWVIKRRNKDMVWMFHNMHPHQGDNNCSKNIQRFLFKNSTLIISHSQDAADYAATKACCPVIYKCHPVIPIPVVQKKEVQPCDVFIWGTIFPYKGIVEFLSFLEDRKSGLKVVIIGKCNDSNLAVSIEKYCSANVSFENRHAGFDELASYIRRSKYVLFPYIGDCVSSSGAMIDSIVFGGNVIGPNIGAFKDLSRDGVSLVYDSYDHLLQILNSKIEVDNQSRESFIIENSWENFSDFLYAKLLNDKSNKNIFI